jgi:hypothetical protein
MDEARAKARAALPPALLGASHAPGRVPGPGFPPIAGIAIESYAATGTNFSATPLLQ